MHYSEKILKNLEKDGWIKSGDFHKKKYENVRPVGRLSDGSRIVDLQFCERDRYIIVYCGFEEIVDIDCRDNRKNIGKIIDEKVYEYFQYYHFERKRG